MAIVTGLSGNEIFCLEEKGFEPGQIVVGNSVNSMGFLRAFGASANNAWGGEVTQVTEQISDARQQAFKRMIKEAKEHGASGVTGVTSELLHSEGNTEFLFVGSCVHKKDGLSHEFFSSAGSAQELYCHMDAGYQPVEHVFGNIAYSIGIGGGIMGSLKTLKRGEIKDYSDIYNETRHAALRRITNQARDQGANAVVGIHTNIMPWHGTHEMTMTGTSAKHDLLPVEANRAPVTSDLTGEELWAMTKQGYAPVKMLMSTSVYSLGLVGSFKAMFRSMSRGEIPELSTLIHEARENVIDRISSEADDLGASHVVGTKTFYQDFGGGLIEFMAVGTAIKKIDGFNVQTPVLPAPALIRDRDTWIAHRSGFRLES